MLAGDGQGLPALTRALPAASRARPEILDGFGGHARISPPSTDTLVSPIPNFGHSAMNVSGPSGGSGHSHWFIAQRPSPPPPPRRHHEGCRRFLSEARKPLRVEVAPARSVGEHDTEAHELIRKRVIRFGTPAPTVTLPGHVHQFIVISIDVADLDLDRELDTSAVHVETTDEQDRLFRAEHHSACRHVSQAGRRLVVRTIPARTVARPPARSRRSSVDRRRTHAPDDTRCGWRQFMIAPQLRSCTVPVSTASALRTGRRSAPGGTHR